MNEDEVEAVQDGAILSELISFKPCLFLLTDYSEESEQPDMKYVNLDTVESVHVFADELVLRMTSGAEHSTDDVETIARFWAEWEII